MSHGFKKHVAVRCDEEEGHAWDVWRLGRVVQSGIPTRSDARATARVLNDIERDTQQGERRDDEDHQP